MLADVFERAAVHERVLTELHLDQVEAKGLGLPDDLLDRAVRRADGAGLREGRLDGLEVADVVLRRLVHDVGRALDRRVQAVGDHDHGGAVQLGRGHAQRGGRQRLAHLHLVAPEVHELLRRLRGARVEREVAAHPCGAVTQRLQHVDAVLLGHLAAHLRGDVGVAVAVRSDPAAGVEERGAHGRHGAGLAPQLPVVEAAVHVGHGVKQRVVEDRDDRVGLLDRRRLLDGDGAGAQQGLDLLQHAALVLRALGRPQERALLQQVRDTADLALGRLAARLGGVGGEHGMELQALQQRVGLRAAALVNQPVIGNGDLVHGVLAGLRVHAGLAGAQRVHAVVLLADVCKVEVGGQRAHDQGLVLEGHLVDGAHAVVERVLALLAVVALGLAARRDQRVVQDVVELVAQARVVLLQHLAHQTQEQRHVRPDGIGNVHAGEHRGRLRELGCLLHRRVDGGAILALEVKKLLDRLGVLQGKVLGRALEVGALLPRAAGRLAARTRDF